MRCIKCGSRKVSLVKINEGYSFTKGIVGQAVLIGNPYCGEPNRFVLGFF